MPRAADLLNYRTPQLAAGQVDRSIPMATPSGQFVPTPPTESQLKWEGALSNPSIANILYGAGETAYGLVTAPIPYAAGMVGSAYGALTGQDPRATGARFEQATTFQPQSPTGQYYSEQAGEKFSSLPPVVSGIPLATLGQGSMRYAGEQYAKPIAEKALTMYEQGKLTPGFTPAADILIGKTAKTFDANAPTMVGPDGLIRQEVSDKSSFVKGNGNFQDSVMDFLHKNDDLVMSKQGGEVLLKNIFEHPNAYAAYPELADYRVRFINKDSGLYGKKGSDNTIHVRSDLSPEEAKSTILHEIQHHIQENEGFARGGSARVFAKEPTQEHNRYMGAINGLNKQMKEAIGTPQYAALMDERDALVIEARQRGVLYPTQITAIANDKYKRLGGEAESRLVQERRNMTAEELALQNPYDPEYFKRSTGVELQDLIMQGNKPATDIFSILYK
jgi:hypothetical protein